MIMEKKIKCNSMNLWRYSWMNVSMMNFQERKFQNSKEKI
jgi:hypothetical protein